ncbi:MAG: FxsA family protein [Nitrospinae bacterium]|nr:FxsA family protein [Nitrospinota bacterium]
MMLYFAACLALGSVIEIYLLKELSVHLSIINTISEIMLTFLVGIFVGRSWGPAYFEKLQRSLRSRTLPSDDTVYGVTMALASMALITPGLVTDVLGLLILIPAARPFFMNMVLNLAKVKIQQGQQYFFFQD